MSFIHTYSNYRSHLFKLYHVYGIPSYTLKQRRSKRPTISVFKSLNNLYPEGLKNMFKTNLLGSLYSYNVRSSSNKVFVPRPRTEAAKRYSRIGEQTNF